MGSMGPSTSTLYSSSSSSSGSTGVKRGSRLQAEMALCRISSATLSYMGPMVPMQPRNAPRIFSETNTPAFCAVISGIICCGERR